MKFRKISFLAAFLFCSFMISNLNMISAPQEKEVLPPGILPVVIISGSDYEMGFQYGQQAAQYIEVNVIANWATALQQFRREEVLNTLKINQYFIEQYTPENIEIMKGMADGASAQGFDISYQDILLMNITLPDPETSSYPKDAENSILPSEKSCSVSSAWGSATKSGKLIGMETLDGSGESRFGIVIIAFPDEGNNYICAADAGEIGNHFLMNNKGFFLGNSGGGSSPRAIDDNYGICWAASLPHIVRFANNAKEARDMIVKWQINVPENFHFVDIYGNAFVVEKTAAVQAVRNSGDFGERDFMFSTNTYLNDKMKVTKFGDFVNKHGGFDAYSSPRNMLFWDMLNNYHGEVDVEFMKMILRFPGNPPPYPPEGGWDAKICRPTNSWVSVLQPDNGDNGLVDVCTGPAGKVIQSSMAYNGKPMRSNYQYIDGTNTFYRLQLASAPKDVVNRAKADAKDYLATAYKEFMQLTPKDTEYAYLKEIFSNANKEYYRGNQAFDKALLANGNEALLLFAKAATEYTRCQAHAMEVYEAILPPATSPTDLGLKPFGGDWAEWETKVGKK